ncbi:hypothetical protein LA351_08850 [Bacteroides fragilis]|jgi:pyruvate formate-lyase activating enzyme-like uncharacterized protein|uniref:Uncharacterized protein n=1 Tax=Bacteroides fragilis (strain ATCC 25285 / DSM 2151 / CCUG 4856 / JCM 11019 / LMG 10263 / NCTC 9343 / Onslow / VPI 2553 / EN-2) TaxID=272559 RepID=Q5L9W8_BACFN|nr:hypothetical protein [Bacteroides fragilis]ANQ61610.1 hypothetical protein AE940_12830 [Bacteroides fragilis]KXU42974.1 hypothetical protein HMPREF2530_03365 [Bacteroides fragilis]KXU43096.1 hypothetical protein HMPREF2533_03365 [Bacteroides fragilis]MBK1429096.1 hypothetical protein [Bacteroides fragilis]MCA5606042.1 hypothetical protein [Bacteroides fragilis]
MNNMYILVKIPSFISYGNLQTATMIIGTPLSIAESYVHKNMGEILQQTMSITQIRIKPTDKNKLFLNINHINVSDWFKEQLNKLNQSVRMKQRQKIVRVQSSNDSILLDFSKKVKFNAALNLAFCIFA